MQSDCCAYLAFRSQRHGGTTILPEAVGFENAILLKEDGVELEAGDVIVSAQGTRQRHRVRARSGCSRVGGLWGDMACSPGPTHGEGAQGE